MNKATHLTPVKLWHINFLSRLPGLRLCYMPDIVNTITGFVSRLLTLNPVVKRLTLKCQLLLANIPCDEC